MWNTLLLTLLAPSLPVAPVALRPDIQVRYLADTGGGGASLKIARDPVDGTLLVLRQNGAILRLDVADGNGSRVTAVYSRTDTGINVPYGFAFGPEGNLYLVGTELTGNFNVVTVRRGVRTGGGDARTWSTLAKTVPYPRSDRFDHQMNGMVVSPDGRSLFLNSGSRTDHGEVEDLKGAFPGLREIPLTSAMLRLPTDGRDIVLPNDEAQLRAGGYFFADGLRNSFDPAFSPDGQLFAGENSGDRDDSEELNWIREGRHYGFPWRMGGVDTPQQFRGYVPTADRLLNHGYIAWQWGLFYDDPTYPPPPTSDFTEPVENVGPDADGFRDPETGAVKRASELGLPLYTFTAHRSPLGLVFDVEGALSDEFRGDGFILGWTKGNATGDAASGPYRDPGQDLLHLELTRTEESYRVATRRIVSGFNGPVDAEIEGNRIYVLENGGNGSVWEVTLPAAPPPPSFLRGRVNGDASVDVSDAVAILFFLFAGGPADCRLAADLDDDGRLDVSDAIRLLGYLFLEAPAPAEPFVACGPDPTPDPGGDLDCRSPPGCN